MPIGSHTLAFGLKKKPAAKKPAPKKTAPKKKAGALGDHLLGSAVGGSVLSFIGDALSKIGLGLKKKAHTVKKPAAKRTMRGGMSAELFQ